MSQKNAKPDMTQNSTVIVDELNSETGSIGILTLNLEKTLNSLTLEMVHSLTVSLKKWANDDSVKAVILRGAGDRAFCAGGDVQALYQSAINPVDGICVEAEEFFFHEYQLNYLIHTYDKPIICLGNGIVMGGGLGLMAGASHRVVTETTRIAMPEISIGIFPDVGATSFLNQLPYNLGYFFALTGAPMNANDALFCQLADYAILWKDYDQLLESIKSISWATETETNHGLIRDLLSVKSCATSSLPDGNIKHNLATLEETCRHNSLSRMIEAIEHFDSDNVWLSKAKNTLNQGSALSALVIYEQLKRHMYADLQSVFISEYTLMCNLVQQPDFVEGVRALLIDKDKNPQWHYKDATHISSTLLESLFTARWEQHPLEMALTNSTSSPKQ
jgi:enoyl-CoA hydratase/carnithine racemase|tara:strand:+ start:796 stop:1965 length:1170 start_codon:yes stop_codon:yes gene_type:complete